MRESLARVERDHDAMSNRLSGLEVRQAESAETPRTTAPQTSSKPAGGPPTPALQVIRIAPQQDDEEMEVDDGPRPSIRIHGSEQPRPTRGKVRPPRTEVTEFRDVPETNLGTTASGTTASGTSAQSGGGNGPSAFDPNAKKAYDDALALVFAKRYPEARDAFAAFLLKWPDHPNADNAHYWRGETYFAQGEFKSAAEQFTGVISQFPLGNKAPDALLKLSITKTKLGDVEGARAALEKLRRDYPRSEAARKAGP
jgi:tol-pal system protein YbgF